MSESAIRAALEIRLMAMTPALDTASENTKYTPVMGVPYQRVNLMRAQPNNPEAGTFKQALGILQVTLEYPQNVGPAVSLARADALAAWFPRKLSLVSGGITVIITRATYIMAGFQDGDRWAIPVRIFYQADVS